jgi:hypothetical protein
MLGPHERTRRISTTQLVRLYWKGCKRTTSLASYNTNKNDKTWPGIRKKHRARHSLDSLSIVQKSLIKSSVVTVSTKGQNWTRYSLATVPKQDRLCAFKRNFEARSCNHCCSGKAVNVTYSEYVSVALVIPLECACALSYGHLWPVWFNHIFPHYLINDKILEKITNMKCVFWFSLQLLPESLLILRFERDIIINLYMSLSKIFVILVRF